MFTVAIVQRHYILAHQRQEVRHCRKSRHCQASDGKKCHVSDPHTVVAVPCAQAYVSGKVILSTFVFGKFRVSQEQRHLY